MAHFSFLYTNNIAHYTPEIKRNDRGPYSFCELPRS